MEVATTIVYWAPLIHKNYVGDAVLTSVSSE